MDMSDHKFEPDDEQTAPPTPKPKRKRRASTTAQGEPKRTGRFERRALKAQQTLRDIIRLKRPDLDVEGMTFVEVVDRDAEAWGKFLAQLAEWVVPFGQLVDLVFGSPVALVVGLAPSVRAARRDLSVRRARKQEAARQAQEEAAALREGMPVE